MISRAQASFVRMAPRKMRYVLDLLRNKSVPQALSILTRTHKKASEIVRKLILTAADAAEKQHQVAAEDLKIVRLFADQAGIMKRFRAMSLGRAGEIRKRLSHVVVELDRISPAPKAPAAAKQEKKSSRKLVGASK